MYSTYPHIANYTVEVLEAACNKANTSIEGYRLGTLKHAEVEITQLLETEAQELMPETREALRGLLNQIRTAIGED